MNKNYLGLATVDYSSEYRSGGNDPIEQFYIPSLKHANLYKRAVGYFRSSVYLITGLAIIDFAKRGGKIRLICSPNLSEHDIKAIDDGYAEQNTVISDNLVSQIDELLGNKVFVSPTKILATLVSLGILEIKIAWRPNSQGIYHEKIGIFLDEFDNRVSFIGSANETWNALDSRGNFESLEVFCNWHHDIEKERSSRHEANFDKLWAGGDLETKIIPFPEASRLHLCAQSLQSLNDAEIELTALSEAYKTSKKRKALPHQTSAIEGWIAQGRRGIFEHATGSGKTFTALESARPHLDSGLPVLILVPSQLLLKQWALEIKLELPQAALTLAGAGNNSWKAPGRLTRISSKLPIGARVILVTMQTAASDLFRRCLMQGSHLMVIADEVHQIGSTYNSQCLLIDSGPRLGLSATPKRYGDPEGTKRLFDYFGNIVQPPITLMDAVKAGRLVEYEYFPHPIYLSLEESQEWRSLTRKIRYEMARLKSDEGGVISDKAKMLILRRARIAKKAEGKITLATKILKKNYQIGQSWLVYCEDSTQLNQIRQSLNNQNIKAIEYHTGMDGSQAASLQWFKDFGGILISIKCLDEGVDIPKVSHALILASSQNPRQFIQRRGRVLRKSDGKYLAVIHDAVVTPVNLDEEPEQASLLKSEFLRAIEFSDSAINKSAGARLRAMAREMGFDPDSTGTEGIEEEEDNND